jgi:hypothetical protein
MSLKLIDDLLGCGVALAGHQADIVLTRYGAVGEVVYIADDSSAYAATITSAEPISYIDAQAVSLITTQPMPGPASRPPSALVDAWTMAMTGYIAGLAAAGLELAGSYAQQRRAFGRSLSEIDSVAKKLADCATAGEGLLLGGRCRREPSVLIHACASAVHILRACHQIVGGIGFTLEYPLQRYLRRAEALRAWTPTLVSGLHASAVRS